jgi:AcrR family transcriptional regulator
VAERAGLARSAIYNYVSDKHALALAAAERTVGVAHDRLRAAVLARSTAAERLRTYVRVSLLAQARHPAAATDLMPLLDEEEQAHLRGILQPVRDLLDEVVRDGVAAGELRGDPDALSAVIWATLAGLRLPVARGEVDAEDAAASAAAVLLDGMVAPGRRA